MVGRAAEYRGRRMFSNAAAEAWLYKVVEVAHVDGLHDQQTAVGTVLVRMKTF